METVAGPDVIATIDDGAITLAEFEEQYLRTATDRSTAAEDSLGAYLDFLDRYVNFRLKVLEAEKAGYADREDLRSELNTYRSQLARPYLLEREVTEPLLKELYDRKAEMVDVSHILIRVAAGASPTDTLRAYQKLEAIVDSVNAGSAFADMAIRHSEDPSASNAAGGVGYAGRLGYFSGGRMVKAFEDRMYTTPVGSMSDVFRTQFGYHVAFIHDRRPAESDRRLSHIMIQAKGTSSADTLNALARLDSVVTRLNSGEDFGLVATEMTDDQQSAPRGGDLDYVAYDGWLPPEMRDAAFALEAVGQTSAPIQTRFGWHIVKLTGLRERPSFEESREALESEIARLPRAQAAETAYARSLRRQYNGRVDSTIINRMYGTQTGDSLVFLIRQRELDPAILQSVIATLGDSSYTVSRFADFLAQGPVPSVVPGTDRFGAAMNAFLDSRALEYEIGSLENRDESFARTMREFREGLMLFRLMEDSVWSAATADTLALKNWYRDRADSYRFPDRTRILAAISGSDSLLSAMAESMDRGETFASLAAAMRADSVADIRFDTTLVEGDTGSIYDQALLLPPGGRTDVLALAGKRYLLVNDGVDPARAKTFEEARSEIANEWQGVLDDRLVERLRQEHRVRTWPERLERAFREGEAPSN